EDYIRYDLVTGVQTCALPISLAKRPGDHRLDYASRTGRFASADRRGTRNGARRRQPRNARRAVLPIDGERHRAGADGRTLGVTRSEERRVGKETSGGWTV